MVAYSVPKPVIETLLSCRNIGIVQDAIACNRSLPRVSRGREDVGCSTFMMRGSSCIAISQIIWPSSAGRRAKLWKLFGFSDS